ncbi:MAG: O-antigen ligase family protein [Candidatus Solibacter usitatus]|nr:O-antigen ligase family protein [Candidatus Solibacter usitatus]
MTTRWEPAAFWCAFGAAAASAVSIAASQTLLGLALAAMLAGRLRWRLPAHWPALAIFAGWTILSLAFSDSPRAGLPQIRKLYVWAMLFVVLAMFRSLRDVRWLAAAWLAGGTLSALRGLWQFAAKWTSAAQAGKDFYLAYVGDRITGFMSHWMTFSGQMMIVLLFGAALLLWGKPQRRLRWALIACLPVIALALVLAFTRGVWIAAAAGGIYLLWSWKRWTVALLPAAALLAFAAGPAGLRQRLVSLVRPHGQTDSNLHRVYTLRTGIEMIKAHPLLGLGPERVGPHFSQYVPPDLPKALPEGYYGHLHNIYVHFAAERGLPAMLALVWFLLMNLRDWLAALRAGAGDGAWALHAGVAVLIGILVTGLFEYNLGDSEILAMTLASLGAAPAAGLSRRA